MTHFSLTESEGAQGHRPSNRQEKSLLCPVYSSPLTFSLSPSPATKNGSRRFKHPPFSPGERRKREIALSGGKAQGIVEETKPPHSNRPISLSPFLPRVALPTEASNSLREDPPAFILQVASRTKERYGWEEGEESAGLPSELPPTSS